jgi:hypothetical protein
MGAPSSVVGNFGPNGIGSILVRVS